MSVAFRQQFVSKTWSFLWMEQEAAQMPDAGWTLKSDCTRYVFTVARASKQILLQILFLIIAAIFTLVQLIYHFSSSNAARMFKRTVLLYMCSSLLPSRELTIFRGCSCCSVFVVSGIRVIQILIRKRNKNLSIFCLHSYNYMCSIWHQQLCE